MRFPSARFQPANCDDMAYTTCPKMRAAMVNVRHARTDRKAGSMKEWGRIGTHGRVTAARYDSEHLALAALQKQAERKRKRGYRE